MSANSQKAIRLALIRELETINHYQELHDLADDADVKQLMLHLMDEEKEHVAELTEILRRLDPEQNRYFEEGHAVEIGSGGVPVQGQRFEAPAAPTASSSVRPPFFAPSGLTVGSLMGVTQ